MKNEKVFLYLLILLTLFFVGCGYLPEILRYLDSKGPVPYISFIVAIFATLLLIELKVIKSNKE